MRGASGSPFRRRDALDHGLEELRQALARLGADEQGLGPGDADDVLHLLERILDLDLGQVDLVDDRDEDEVVVDGQVGVGQGLGLDPLGGVDDEEGPVAGGQAPRDLVGEIDVAGGVDQVEDIVFPREALVGQADGLGLDGDAPLPLEVHGVQDLLLELPGGQGPGQLDEPVGQGRFAVVDVGDDGEVPDVLHGIAYYRRFPLERPPGADPPRPAPLQLTFRGAGVSSRGEIGLKSKEIRMLGSIGPTELILILLIVIIIFGARKLPDLGQVHRRGHQELQEVR